MFTKMLMLMLLSVGQDIADGGIDIDASIDIGAPPALTLRFQPYSCMTNPTTTFIAFNYLCISACQMCKIMWQLSWQNAMSLLRWPCLFSS